MHIAICDDDCSIYLELIAHIQKYYAEQGVMAQFDTYGDAESFLETEREYDILFIDIYMKKTSGVEAVSQLPAGRVKNVIFLTSSRDHAIDAFRLGARHYLLKPIDQDDVITALKRCGSDSSVPEDAILTLSVSSGTITIPYSKISYIEAINKRTLIHTDKKIFTVYISLDHLYEMLDDSVFMRAQRSYIVNMGRITFFSSDHIVLDSENEITLARARQEEIKRQYQSYLFRMTRRSVQ